VWEFVEGGAEDQVTVRRNRAAFEQLAFRPRVLVDVSKVDQSTTVLGQRLATPLILAPTGMCGMAIPQGELAAARAATRAESLFTLSTMSGVSIEDVARLAPGPHWFQLYVCRDRDLTRRLIERARVAGYRALVLTTDVPVFGRRESDYRNGAIPPRVTWRNAWETGRKVGWLWRMARHGHFDFANFSDIAVKTKRLAFQRGEFVNSQLDPSVGWHDLEWFRSLWQGPVAIKGIMTAEDARRAVECGADAVIVSNHGGRQLDGLPAAVDVLPEVVDAVGDRAEVILDGGVRRGTDVVKAMALGARACMMGRPYIYGLAVAGEAGVALALSMLYREIEKALALVGCSRLSDLDRSFLRTAGPVRPSGIAAPDSR